MIVFEAKRLGKNGIWHTIGLYKANSIVEVEVYLTRHDVEFTCIIPRAIVDIYEEVVL